MDIRCFPHTLHIGEGFSFYFIVLTSFSLLNDLLGFFLMLLPLFSRCISFFALYFCNCIVSFMFRVHFFPSALSLNLLFF